MSKTKLIAIVIFALLSIVCIAFYTYNEAYKQKNDKFQYDIVGRYVGSIMNGDGIRSIDVYVCGEDTVYMSVRNQYPIAVSKK